MTTLSFARNKKALLKGATELLLVAPAGYYDAKSTPRLLGRRLDALVKSLASDLTPGPRGAVASTLGAEGLRWLHVVSLPNTLSRYNSPTRADSIRHCISQTTLGSKGKVAVILVLDDPSHALAAANAVNRALPAYTVKSKGGRLRVQIMTVDRKGAELPVDKDVQRTVQFARESAVLVDTPPTELDPAEFATRAQAALEKLDGVTIEQYVGDELVENGLMGIHSVGRSAVSAPRMLVASYDPGGASTHVALVGKGVTFDTGGLHLKARGAMEGMKADMGGAAAVFGAFRSLVTGGCAHRVTLILCLAENSADGASYKPDDVLHMHSGKTVEINNTDAEGRLTMADAMVYASKLEPALMIDFATLTGACIVALGPRIAGVMTDDERLYADWMAAADRSGEDMWRLPLPGNLKEQLKSKIADMRNTGERWGGALTAGLFLSEFTEGVRWMHVDIAGPAMASKAYGVTTPGGTGVPVATILELLRGEIQV